MGVEVTTPSGPLTAHAILLLSSLDLPARALVTNMKQYNGKYACCYCESERQPRRSSHLHRNWPYEDVRLPRSNESIKRNARAAIQHHQSVSIITLLFIATLSCSVCLYNIGQRCEGSFHSVSAPPIQCCERSSCGCFALHLSWCYPQYDNLLVSCIPQRERL